MERKILIVDDEPKMVEVVNDYLKASGFNTLLAFNGKEALKIFKSEKPDLIILDLMLPDISGEDICKKIREISNVPIIMLTAKSAESQRVGGLEMGADDYVTKPFSPKELVARVKVILRRIEPSEELDTLSFDKGNLLINITNMSVRLMGELISLTPNEFKILVSLASHTNKVFTREELIAVICNGDYEGYDRAIDSHIKNLRKKIEVDSKKNQYIITVHGVGYKFGKEKD